MIESLKFGIPIVRNSLTLFCVLAIVSFICIVNTSCVCAQNSSDAKATKSSDEKSKETKSEQNAETPSENDKGNSKPTESDKYAKPPASRFLPPVPAETPKTERQLAEERKKREAARKQGEITFDDLKFDIEKGGEFKSEMLTKDIKELDKKVLKLRGFILPTSVFQQSGIKQFVLVRDNQECCFGPGAAIYDCVIVEMQPGKTTNFATRVVTVKGKFEIDTKTYQYPDGGHYAIFKMTAEEVK